MSVESSKVLVLVGLQSYIPCPPRALHLTPHPVTSLPLPHSSSLSLCRQALQVPWGSAVVKASHPHIFALFYQGY